LKTEIIGYKDPVDVNDSELPIIKIFSKNRSFDDYKNLSEEDQKKANKQEECLLSGMFALSATILTPEIVEIIAVSHPYGNETIVALSEAADQTSQAESLMGKSISLFVVEAVDKAESYANDCICAFK
jgi:hypothetical protein